MSNDRHMSSYIPSTVALRSLRLFSWMIQNSTAVFKAGRTDRFNIGVHLRWSGHKQFLLKHSRVEFWASSLIWKVVLKKMQWHLIGGSRKSWKEAVRFLAWVNGDVTNLRAVKKRASFREVTISLSLDRLYLRCLRGMEVKKYSSRKN